MRAEELSRLVLVGPLALGLLVLAACTPGRGDLLDACDGTDNDGDGAIDENDGEHAGCLARELCVSGECVANCGDGVCSPESDETCGSCPGDCGACPACGDGACNGSETCTSCRSDCPLCPGECSACGPGFSCPSGLECRLRLCDGAAACIVPGVTTGCAEVGGLRCGSVSAYDRCTADADCGARMTCSGGRCNVGQSSGISDPVCGTDRFWCPPAPDSPAGLDTECVSACVPHRETCYHSCQLTCTGSCPYGMVCSMGYCIDP